MSKNSGSKKWNYKQWTIVTRTLCLVGGGLLLGRLFTGNAACVLPGLVLLVPGMLIAAFTLNCPTCGRLIGDLLTHNSKKCPHCNTPLEPIFERKQK